MFAFFHVPVPLTLLPYPFLFAHLACLFLSTLCVSHSSTPLLLAHSLYPVPSPFPLIYCILGFLFSFSLVLLGRSIPPFLSAIPLSPALLAQSLLPYCLPISSYYSCLLVPAHSHCLPILPRLFLLAHSSRTVLHAHTPSLHLLAHSSLPLTLPIFPRPSYLPIPPHLYCLPILYYRTRLQSLLPFLLAYPSPPFLLASSSSPSCLPIPLIPLLPFTEENPPGPRRADEKPLPLTCKSDSSWHHFSPGAADMATRGDGCGMNKHTHFANDLSFCWVWECLRRAFVETRCLVLMHQKSLGISGVLILMCLFIYLFIGFWAFSFWPVCVPFCLP